MNIFFLREGPMRQESFADVWSGCIMFFDLTPAPLAVTIIGLLFAAEQQARGYNPQTRT
jgi:hypothetical protein